MDLIMHFLQVGFRGSAWAWPCPAELVSAFLKSHRTGNGAGSIGECWRGKVWVCKGRKGVIELAAGLGLWDGL